MRPFLRLLLFALLTVVAFTAVEFFDFVFVAVVTGGAGEECKRRWEKRRSSEGIRETTCDRKMGIPVDTKERCGVIICQK